MSYRQALHCKNCGRNEFKEVNDRLICKYCLAGFYLPFYAKFNYKKYILFPVGVIIMVTFTLSISHSLQKPSLKKDFKIEKNAPVEIKEQRTNSIYENNRIEDTLNADPKKVGLEHISDVKGWTKRDFEQIKINGTQSIENLIKEKGAPQEIWEGKEAVFSNSAGEPAFADSSTMTSYIWKSEDYKDFNIEIHIARDNKTGMIVQKEVGGRDGLLKTRYAQEGMDRIHMVGWTKEKFKKIRPATLHYYKSNHNMVEGGDSIVSFLKYLPNPSYISRGHEIKGMNTVTYEWKNKDSEKGITIVKLIIQEESNRIVKKEIEGYAKQA
ncbi:hypothetical protein QR692_10310 [Lactococcus petauri]|uniref:hypothetical protein n=1 Tax=Lactococcus petauri TaxID=1940789 RepID=UPI0020789D8F|nr:hypothetical protein [Lactococcus petauri]USI65376.1 hypothetical protein LMK05_11195 [Lactococcus petauri]USI67871.1 hypothetical protein LMK04_10430 [Lactococcus petauri]WJE12532.1 hypothetical protein QR692_10310 [Lactococcus petauri]